MKHPDYPGVSSRLDRHGKKRWIFRKAGKTIYLPGEPGTKPFDDTYQATIEGRVIKKAEVIRHPHSAFPQSLNACWAKVKARKSWEQLDANTLVNYSHEIEEFLSEPSGGGITVGENPVADLRPRHVQDALDKLSGSRGRVLLTVLRKMMKEAMLQEWIEYDPTYSASPARRDSEGHVAWPPHWCARYELRWPVGTTPRTAYELARWLGVRRSDIALVRWDQLVTRIEDGEVVEGFQFVQFKGRRKKGAFAKFHPISPMLAEALAPLDRTTGTVLAKPNGRPYAMKSLSAMMRRDWAPAAGIPDCYSLHGLRKALGGMLADAEATAHQSRDVLGHATFKEAEFYARSRDQAKAATGGMRKVVKLVRSGNV